jgi:hypothetical protein
MDRRPGRRLPGFFMPTTFSLSPSPVMPAKACIALHPSRKTTNALVGARLRAMLLLARRLQLAEQELSSACGSRVTFSLRAHACAGAHANGEAGPKGGGQDARSKEKDNQRERPPRLALAGHPARQVREPWPGFSTGHPALAKRSRHPCRLPLRGLSSPTHRRTRAPGRAARHPGAHSVRNRYAVARTGRGAQRERLLSSVKSGPS